MTNLGILQSLGLREAPEGWRIMPMFTVFNETREKNLDGAETNLLSLSYGRVVRRDIESTFGLLPASFNTYQIVEPGQIVLRLTDMQNDKQSLRTGLVSERGIITSAYCALQPEVGIPNFFAHYFHALDASKVLYSLGGGVRQSLGFDELKHVPVLVPPPDTQERIVRFLDVETAKIDRLIAWNMRQCELVEERVAAEVERVALHGLRKSTTWEVSRIKHLFHLRDELSYAERDEVTLLSLYTKFGVRKYDEVEERTGNPVRTVEGYKVVYPGDIVVNIILAWMGAIGRSEFQGVISPAYDIWIPTPEVSSRYYHYLLRTKWLSGECFKRGKGIMLMRWRTYAEQFGDISVPVPPLEEQQQIADFLDKRVAESEYLLARLRSMNLLLQERRSALITAAVTGQIEV